MDRVVRKFAHRVLAIHAGLFLLVLVIVAFASRAIYNSAREQALAQARQNQALLAAQTARGIEDFYQSLLAGLHLVRDAEEEPEVAGAAAAAVASTQPGHVLARRLPHEPIGPRGVLVARLVARQFEGRASQVFIFDRVQHKAFEISQPDVALPRDKVAAQLADWFATVEHPQISPFRALGDMGYNAVAVPVHREAHRLIVATVPVRAMASRLLDRLGRDETIATLLADDEDRVMAAGERAWIGRNLSSLGAPMADMTMQKLRAANLRGVKEIEQPFRVGDVQCPPAMFASEPVHVADKQWLLLVASDLSAVDGVVNSLVKRGIGWVIFALLSMTALLVSTAVQLIRNRARLEGERARVLEAELAEARQIQLAWLPEPTGSDCDSLDVSAVNLPASHISGDFYNWFALPDGRTAIVIGDVTGHGMSAAFLMATAQMLVRNTLPRTLDPGRCLEEVNRQLCVQMFYGQFVTMQVVVLDPENGRLSIANAGHPPPLCGDGESFQPLKVEPQLVLGIEKGAEYPTETFDLAAGANVLLYTDGIVEAVAADGSRFETERLQRSIYGTYENAAALVKAVVDSVTTFRAGRELADDLTIVAIQLQGARSAATTAAVSV
jgi:serine phosphatase RsbU (regulator of sigma subunit)